MKNRFSRDCKTGKKEQIPKILIMCEGRKTEKNYFEKFEVRSADVEVVGTGYNTLSLVKKASKKHKSNIYDQVWCVFDKDSFSDNDFNSAVAKAKNSGMRVAFSNESFELWFLLHFEYLNTGIGRNQYIDKLNDIFTNKKSEGFPAKYKKDDKNIYGYLKPYQKTAIKNSKRLYGNYCSGRVLPAKMCPVTSVHELVEELNKWIPSNRLQ